MAFLISKLDAPGDDVNGENKLKKQLNGDIILT